MDAEETEELEEPREETREEKSNEYSDAVLLSLEKKETSIFTSLWWLSQIGPEKII